MENTLLLVDDEERIRKAIQRLCRKEGYRIFVAASAEEALSVLKHQPVAVIVSDQRLPGMSGVEFFSQVKILYPDSIRLMISGYTALESLEGAINDGAIFKFLFKPWDDEQLISNLREAFSIFRLREQNKLLTDELRALNSELEARVEQKTKELSLHIRSLRLSREIFDKLPFIAIGVSEDDYVVGANQLAIRVMCNDALVGRTTEQAFPADLYGAFSNWKNERLESETDNTSEKLTFTTNFGRFYVTFSDFQMDESTNGYLISGAVL